MTLRRRQWLAAVLFSVAALALVAVPFRLWFTARESAINAANDAVLTEQMESILYGEITETRDEWPIGYFVDSDTEYREPFGDYDIEPPLNQWMRESNGEPSFREYTVDETRLSALVRPINDTSGYVTLAYTADRDDQLADLRAAAWRWGLALVAICVLVGIGLSRLMILPLRRMLGDQQTFLADAAHEMRTPLAVILASSSQALARQRSNEEYVRSLSEIRSAAERASTGVNEMLDLVRFENGQMMPRLGPLRVDLLTEEVAASVRVDDVEIVAVLGATVIVQADMALLRQAIENVVRNASRRARHVELVTRTDRSDGVIEIRDNGPGFDPNILPHVFERYQRGDLRGEVGIGLAIVRAIAAAHGGSVTAANIPGDDGGPAGAVVTLRIPLARLTT